MVVVSSTFTPPANGVLFHNPNVKLVINDQPLGIGHLYIAEDEVVWGGGVLMSGGPSPNINLQYPTIAVHGVQKDPIPALCVMINFELSFPELGNVGGGDAQSDDEYDPDDPPITHLRFEPQGIDDVHAMHVSMCAGQALHPDPTDDDDEDYLDGEDGDDEMFEDAEEVNPAADDPAARLRDLQLENANGHYNVSDEEGGDVD